MRPSAIAFIGAVVAGTVIAGSAAVAAPRHDSAREARPAAENVPTSVNDVRIAFRDTSDASQNKTVVLHGPRGQHLIALFDALKPEPPGTVHCDAMSTSSTYVTFRGAVHTWVAHEAICTDLTVTRDGKSLPTLVESNKWNAALTHYIGHSPTAPGTAAPM